MHLLNSDSLRLEIGLFLKKNPVFKTTIETGFKKRRSVERVLFV